MLKCILLSRCFELLHHSLKHIRTHPFVNETNTLDVFKYLHGTTNARGEPLSNGRKLNGIPVDDYSAMHLEEVYHSITWVLTSSDLLSELLNTVIDASPVPNYQDCATCCCVLARAIQCGMALLLTYHELVVQYKMPLDDLGESVEICNHGTLCVRKLFDLWGECMLNEKRYVNQIRRSKSNGNGNVSITEDPKPHCLLKYMAVQGEFSSSARGDFHMLSITNCIVQLTHLLCNNTLLASIPMENANGRFAYDVTGVVSDYILSLYIRQCSTGQLLYFLNKESVNAISLRSPITPEQGVLIYSFCDQDGEINEFEANAPNYMRMMLQSLCQLFVQVHLNSLFLSSHHGGDISSYLQHTCIYMNMHINLLFAFQLIFCCVSLCCAV